MNDSKKTKAQLVEELKALRVRVAELEDVEAKRKEAEHARRKFERRW